VPALPYRHPLPFCAACRRLSILTCPHLPRFVLAIFVNAVILHSGGSKGASSSTDGVTEYL
jgi:hypothetical protein